MDVKLESIAEIEAAKSEKLPAFAGLNLLHIKRQVAKILSLFGRNGIFEEYTRHDIGHVDEMLALLEWLVPESTKAIMSPTDWLLIVLGIYFHDVGLLVTRKEFKVRESSGFPNFRDSTLFGGKQGDEYKEKVLSLPKDQQDRFLYQEFVRHNHAERVRWWILGDSKDQLGVTDEIASEVNKLLDPLGSQFRRDLGIIAESHHLEDLNNTKKYSVSQPYGNSDEETGNLQYAAIILRASDLLHITSDRTPAIVYRILNPEDPLSQEEWAKQMAVTRLRPKVGMNDEGNPDPEATSNTIEIFAYFKKEDGFFGLTSYINYASEQLQKCHDWVSTSIKNGISKHDFPWTKIDDSNIETEGFIKDEFRFTIDQEKILDLLTGHTLYNDTSVVVRELVQNSLDAIKLQHFNHENSQSGEVKIHWDSSNRVLSVTDNGTGMTQSIIKNHLLRVGSSLYQDEDFKEKHPGFSSISEFGIGVLTTFMIANKVEIITSHVDEKEARRLLLRSVHGKYLIRVLDKDKEPASLLDLHGTTIKLTLRPGVSNIDILQIAKKWIVVPECKVTVAIDEQEPIVIGYSSPKEALEDFLTSNGKRIVQDMQDKKAVDRFEQPVHVVQHYIDGTTIAYAVKWLPFFHEWTYLSTSSIEAKGPFPIGTCIEGIRVLSESPGYLDNSIFALANATGAHSPKTNVARSGIEASEEYDDMLKSIYSGYCKHAVSEISNICDIRGHSLTWAVQEAQFLLSPLLAVDTFYGESRADALNMKLLEASIKEIPIVLTETQEGRVAISCAEIKKDQVLWTINGPLFSSVENLIREIPENTSIRAVAKSLKASIKLPNERLLCETSKYSTVHVFALEGKEITEIIINKKERRLDLKWQNISEHPRWLVLPKKWDEFLTSIRRNLGSRYYQYRSSVANYNNLLVLLKDVKLKGYANEVAILIEGKILLVGNSPVVNYFREKLVNELQKDSRTVRVSPLLGPLALLVLIFSDESARRDLNRYINQLISSGSLEQYIEFVDNRGAWEKELNSPDLKRAINDTNWTTLDPAVWERGSYF